MRLTVQNFLSKPFFIKIYFFRRIHKLVSLQDIIGVNFFWEKLRADGNEAEVEEIRPQKTHFMDFSLKGLPVYPAFNFGALEDAVAIRIQAENGNMTVSLEPLPPAAN